MDEATRSGGPGTGPPEAFPERLSGGNASGLVERVGGTVRKAATRATPSTWAYMAALREAGIDVPAVRGRDERGRQVLEYVPGELAMSGPPLDHESLARVGRMVRSIHDASECFVAPEGAVWEPLIPAPGGDLVCHNDLAPWNLVRGERWVFIDWDGAAPSTRAWDLAYAAQTFTLNDAAREPRAAAADLAALVDGYGATAELRAALPGLMARRAAAMFDVLAAAHRAGREPWGSMYLNGHGRHWELVARFVAEHEEAWRRALGG